MTSSSSAREELRATAASALPKYQVVIVLFTVPITSRVWMPGIPDTGVSEAVLIVDEPSFAEQIGCATSSTGEAHAL